MSNLYLDLLQLSLLVFSFAFLVIIIKYFSNGLKGLHLVIFCFGALISGTFFNGVYINNALITGLIYPFFVPLFYAMGPALLLHAKRLMGEPIKGDAIHYAPALILLVDLVFYALLNPEVYKDNMLWVMEGNFLKLSHSFIFSGTFLFTAYVMPTSVYAIYTIVLMFRKKAIRRNRDLFALLCSVVILTPLLQDVVNYYIIEQRLLSFMNIDYARGLLVISAPIVLIHATRFVRTNTSLSEVLRTSSKISKKKTFNQEEVSAVQRCIEEELENTASLLLSPGITKELFIDQTDLNRYEWDTYFIASSLRFADVKKKVRIHHAKRMIDDGYLEKYSVEALTFEVGYRSRASFYSAFEKETGLKLTEYRKES